MQSSVKRQKHIEPSKSHFPPKLVFLPQLCLAFLWICFLPPSPLSAYTLPVWNLYGRAALACCLSELAFGGKLLVCELETGAMVGRENWSHGEDIEKARFSFFPSSSGWMQHNLKILKFAQEIPKLDYNIMGWQWHAPFPHSSQKDNVKPLSLYVGDLFETKEFTFSRTLQLSHVMGAHQLSLSKTKPWNGNDDALKMEIFGSGENCL